MTDMMRMRAIVPIANWEARIPGDTVHLSVMRDHDGSVRIGLRTLVSPQALARCRKDYPFVKVYVFGADEWRHLEAALAEAKALRAEAEVLSGKRQAGAGNDKAAGL